MCVYVIDFHIVLFIICCIALAKFSCISIEYLANISGCYPIKTSIFLLFIYFFKFLLYPGKEETHNEIKS